MDASFKEIMNISLDDCLLVYRVHATQRMFERDVSEQDVVRVLRKGEVIEYYENDYPFPSALFCGLDTSGRTLHVVASVDRASQVAYVITTYPPDPQRWIDNFTRRRKS